jgi:hypothetical protein
MQYNNFTCLIISCVLILIFFSITATIYSSLVFTIIFRAPMSSEVSVYVTPFTFKLIKIIYTACKMLEMTSSYDVL